MHSKSCLLILFCCALFLGCETATQPDPAPTEEPQAKAAEKPQAAVPEVPQAEATEESQAAVPEEPVRVWHPLPLPRWKIAALDAPFEEEFPIKFQLNYVDGGSVLQLTGGRETYRVCPAVPLEDGQRFRIIYSLTERGMDGYAPVPHLGVGDEHGTEEILYNFHSAPKLGWRYEILIEHLSYGVHVQADPRVTTMHRRTNPERFQSLGQPLYVFIHMNPHSEVIIHEFETFLPVDLQEYSALSSQ